MPQLNPFPWFAILVLTWLTVLIAVMPKTLSHNFNNSPDSENIDLSEPNTWAWPWA